MEFKTHNVNILRFRSCISQRGIIALATVIVLGTIFVEIGLAGAFVAYMLTNTNYGSRLSAEAYVAAEAGIQDGLLRFVRDSRESTMNQKSYVLNLGARTADVLLCRKHKVGVDGTSCSPLLQDDAYAEIFSVGRALLRERRLRATVSIHPVTGVVHLVSVNE